MKADLLLRRQFVLQHNSKRCPFSLHALAVDGALQQVHQVLADVKAQSLSVSQRDILAVFLLKGHEHLLAEFLADPHSVVRDSVDVPCPAVFISHIGDKIYRASRFRELDRVAQEINEDPLHIFCIHHDIPVFAALDLCSEQKVFLSRFLADDRIHLLDHPGLPGGNAHCYRFAGVDPAGLEDLVDKPHKVPAG